MKFSINNLLGFIVTILLPLYTLAQPTITSFSPSSGPIGTLVTITGANLSNPTALTIGGVNAIAISNTGTSLVAMVMPGAGAGLIGITTTNGSTTSANTFTPTVSVIPAAQQGNKLVGTNSVGANIEQGNSVCISADGTTAIVGGIGDNNYTGAAWVYTKTAGAWSQQGNKLVGNGFIGESRQGSSVALSADGNTAIVGGIGDNNSIGAAWIFTRNSLGIWSQQGNKLVGTTYNGTSYIRQGRSVSISADGNIAIIGGPSDSNISTGGGYGSIWTFSRNSLGIWSQRGNKLIAPNNRGIGTGVSISADGNTLLGDVIIYVWNGSIWSQQADLYALATNISAINAMGVSSSLSADGNTAIVGDNGDSSQRGAARVFTRNNGIWTQQGTKLIGTDTIGIAGQGKSVSISADGNTAVVGGYYDNNMIGATWIYRRNAGIWTQQGNKRVGTGYVLPGGYLGISRQGNSVSISADGNTLFVGGNADNNSTGAAWVFNGTMVPTLLGSFTVDKLNISALLKFTTLTEANSDFIEVQHSLNAIDFTTLEKLIAKGNSTTASHYNFTHANPTNGVNYYRLKMIDKDGKFSLSEIRKIDLSSKKNALVVYPNPVKNGILNIDLGEPVTKQTNYVITTIDGKVVQEGVTNARQTSITIKSDFKGTYILKIANRQPIKIMIN